MQPGGILLGYKNGYGVRDVILEFSWSVISIQCQHGRFN